MPRALEDVLSAVPNLTVSAVHVAFIVFFSVATDG